MTLRTLALATLAVAGTMLALDLTWLNIIAKSFYAAQLGPLMASPVQPVAAACFYVMYVGAVVVHAVRPATSTREAATRGAGLGVVAYATYDLTNWAVIAGWPAMLVPVDLAWGVILTTVAACAGHLAARKAA